jgi:hypothetical protein
MNMNKWSIMLVCLMLISILITPASALVVSLDEKQLNEYSDLIVKGTVIGNTSPQWNTKDGSPSTHHDYTSVPIIRPMIYYDFIIEVDEVQKGEMSNDAENKVYIRHLGGTIDDMNIWVEDQIELEEGQNVILYLMNNENSYTSEFGPKSYFAIGHRFITDEETEKDGEGSKSLPIFKKILSFFSDFGNFFT